MAVKKVEKMQKGNQKAKGIDKIHFGKFKKFGIEGSKYKGSETRKTKVEELDDFGSHNSK